MTNIEKALKLAINEFYGITDIVGVPYIFHLLAVWEGVKKYNDPELECMAILHDLPEDIPGWTIEMLRSQFNDRIANGVDSLTHRPDETYRQYVIRCSKNPDGIKVKMADLEHNMDFKRFDISMGTERFNRYIEYHNFLRLSLRNVKYFEPDKTHPSENDGLVNS